MWITKKREENDDKEDQSMLLLCGLSSYLCEVISQYEDDV